jgi:hypothetical protein
MEFIPSHLTKKDVRKYHTLISKEIEDEEGYLRKRVITLIVRGKLNPRPENLFTIVST